MTVADDEPPPAAGRRAARDIGRLLDSIQPDLRLTRRVVLFLLACIYFSAFASLGAQYMGLYGPDGAARLIPIPANAVQAVALDAALILDRRNPANREPVVCRPPGEPVSRRRADGEEGAAARRCERSHPFRPQPSPWQTLIWLHKFAGVEPAAWGAILCLAGCCLSSTAAVLAVVAPGAGVGWLQAALWFLYLSQFTVGQVFLHFQWDILLLEVGFLAIALPPALWATSSAAPSPLPVWLLRTVFFKLMFMSGAVKLLSGCPAWSSLTATAHHFASQPLPTPLAWWAHHQPPWAHRVVTALTLWVEGPVALLLLSPWPGPRQAAAAMQVIFQAAIAATGNYNFFNALAVCLAAACVDDPLYASLYASLGRGVTSTVARLWGCDVNNGGRGAVTAKPATARGLGLPTPFRPAPRLPRSPPLTGGIPDLASPGSPRALAAPTARRRGGGDAARSPSPPPRGPLPRPGTPPGNALPPTIAARLLAAWHAAGWCAGVISVVWCLVSTARLVTRDSSTGMLALRLTPAQLQATLPWMLATAARGAAACLTIAACVSAARGITTAGHRRPALRLWRAGAAATALGAALVMLCLTTAPLGHVHESAIGVLTPILPSPITAAALALHGVAERYHLSAGYGLFRRMTGVGPGNTTARAELLLEGSSDGTTWRIYEQPYKPGEPGRRPPWVAPHAPRLDWQMWFAALGPDYTSSPWIIALADRLLRGSPNVLALFASPPPFPPGAPPRYVRATLHHYDFAPPPPRGSGANATTRGVWWVRRFVKVFLGPLDLGSEPLQKYLDNSGLAKRPNAAWPKEATGPAASLVTPLLGLAAPASFWPRGALVASASGVVVAVTIALVEWAVAAALVGGLDGPPRRGWGGDGGDDGDGDDDTGEGRPRREQSSRRRKAE